jgi:hypothetical protein
MDFRENTGRHFQAAQVHEGNIDLLVRRCVLAPSQEFIDHAKEDRNEP